MTDDAAAVTAEGADEWSPVVSEDGITFANGQPLQAWAFDAYSAHYGREQSLNALAKAYAVTWRCVRRNVNAVHAFILAVEGTDLLDALAKHKTRLREVQKAAWQDHANADPSARAPYLRIALDAGEKLAAADGCVTERRSVATGQDGALGPQQVQHIGALDALRSRLAQGDDPAGAGSVPGDAD